MNALKATARCLKSKSDNKIKTGEEGLNKIKENFPYFNIFEDVMGCRDVYMTMLF